MRTAQTIEQKKAESTGKVPEGSPGSYSKGKHPNSRKGLANLVAPWKPGESGNPSGRPKDVAGEISRAAFENNREAIYRGITEKLIGGDSYAYSVHSDRGYGKLKQGIIHTGDEDGGAVRTSIQVEFVKQPDGGK